MNEAERKVALQAAFIEQPIRCGPFTLRPLTAGSMMLLQAFGNPIFTAREADAKEPSEDELQMAFYEYIWLHTAPLTEVAAVRTDVELLKTKAFSLALELSLEDMRQFSKQLEALLLRVAASQVEAVSEGKAGKPLPNQTGLPGWSEPSVVPETRSERTGLSGGCPSIEPSNTFTLPSATTASDAVGAIPETEMTAVELPLLQEPGSAG